MPGNDGFEYDFRSHTEQYLWEGFPDDVQDDRHLYDMFHDFMDPRTPGDVRSADYQLIDNYLWEEYDLEFDDIMDWEAWREWYGAL